MVSTISLPTVCVLSVHFQACRSQLLLASILLDRQARFFKTRRRYADLNQAEGFFPAGFFAFSGPSQCRSQIQWG